MRWWGQPGLAGECFGASGLLDARPAATVVVTLNAQLDRCGRGPERSQPFPFLFQDWLHGFRRLFTDTSEHIRFYYLVFFCFTSDSPNLLTLGSDYMWFFHLLRCQFFVLLLCHIIIECCSLVCHEKSGCIFLLSASLISSIGEKCHSRPLQKASTVWAAPTLQNVINLDKKLYRDCLLFAIIWQLKDVRNMLNLY